MSRTNIILAVSLGMIVIFSSCSKDPIQQELIMHADFDGKPDGYTNESQSEIPPPAQIKPSGYEKETHQIELGPDSMLKPDGYQKQDKRKKITSKD